MKSAPFRYERADSLDEALGRLKELGDEAKPLAGGQSLIPLMALRLARPSWLLDLNPLTELADVKINGDVRLGSMLRQRDIERSPALRSAMPLLCEAVSYVGHPQIRNRGTIGGSIAHADPAAELPAVVCAVEGQLETRSASGQRFIPWNEFFASYFQTAIRPDELLTGVTLPVLPESTGTCYSEFSRRHGDFAIVGVAVVLTMSSAQGRLADVRIALAGVAPTPLRATTAEAALRGQQPGSETWRAAGQEAARDIDPPDDLNGPAEYRRHLTAIIVERALATAYSRIGGER